MTTAEANLARALRRLWIRAAVVAALALAIVLLAPAPPPMGITHETEATSPPSAAIDLVIPQAVVDDATRLALELFSGSPAQYQAFRQQLLSSYLEARDQDFIMVFNAGGWGWKQLDPSAEWYSIVSGIQDELEESGYRAFWLDYQRTSQDLRGYLDELTEMITDYPSRAQELASRLTFLTSHVPELKVIVAGESTGSVLSDKVMDLLADNPRVYSIQTGPPFWLKQVPRARTLVLTDNGLTPDAFSRGDVFSMASISLEDMLGFSRSRDMSGNVLYFIGAPGHDYRWQYPSVYGPITDFIRSNFSLKW